jgi:aspartyl protease family protein
MSLAHRLAPAFLALGLATLGPAARADHKTTVMALFKDKAVVLINGTQRTLVVGQPSPEGVELKASTSDAAQLAVHGEVGTYRVGRAIATQFAQATAKEKVHISADAGGMYFYPGSINGKPVTFMLDTGASTVAMGPAVAKSIGLDYRVKGKPGHSQTAAGVVRSHIVELDKVRVGGIELSNVEGTVIEGNNSSEVLLGSSFLGRVHLEREGQMMIMEAR